MLLITIEEFIAVEGLKETSKYVNHIFTDMNLLEFLVYKTKLSENLISENLKGSWFNILNVTNVDEDNYTLDQLEEIKNSKHIDFDVIFRRDIQKDVDVNHEPGSDYNE